MTSGEVRAGASLNAQVGALALAIGACVNLGIQMAAPTLQPLNFAAWLAASFGVLCFCEEMGAGRPLNRAGLVLFAAAFCGDTAAMLVVDPLAAARARLLYAFTVLGALMFWSIALMHRRSNARLAGVLGASVGAGAIALLIAAHLFVGTATIFGFGSLFSALTSPGAETSAALRTIDALLAAWALAAAVLMWTGRLRD